MSVTTLVLCWWGLVACPCAQAVPVVPCDTDDDCALLNPDVENKQCPTLW